MNKNIKFWGKITKDEYFEIDKFPEHLSEFEIEMENFEKFIFEKLNKAGILFSKCKKCGKDILFLTTKTGKQMPITCGLISHFSDCPNAGEFRKK